MNADLIKEYSNEEIKTTLFQMGPMKAPGPDGFPALFYQNHWNFLETDLCHAIRSFLHGGSLPEGFCDSIIVMIPKVTNPEHLKNFRPISLCNVLYKIASKVLANRLKLILPFVISENQSAFVPGRLLTDNALIAYECLHTIRQQRLKRPFFALKVDMMKAYDRVEWNFLFGCLQKLGFDQTWIDTVMRCCVTSVRYAVRVNGELTEPVTPSRGIRQGDPISPYLFLLCTEGLSCLLQQRADQRELQGLCNGRLGPPISHLLFADDSIFFARSDERSVDALQRVLELYCEGSGQKINLDKSSVFFGSHCPEAVKQMVKQKLNVQSEALQETYLGMPTEVGRSPVRTFRYLFNRMWQQMNGCAGRPLSRKGNEIWLKSVIQAIPTHVMSCFQLPISTCDSMRKSVANQWWGFDDGRRKLHWRSWEWLSTPKYLGGLGFRDMALFNQAMLGRQCWRLITEPNSLCARVLKARYFPNCDVMDAPQPRSSSYTWRSIQFGMKLVKKGLHWGLGNGAKIKIMMDPWIPDVKPYMLRPLAPIPQEQTVDSLILEDTKTWDVELVRTIFDEAIADRILQLPISRHGGEDFVSWPHARFGQYTVRSAYHLAREDRFAVDRSNTGKGSSSSTLDNADSKLWRKLWANKAPGKMIITLWRFAHDCLPCGHQLQKRNIPASPACVFCSQYETVDHALLSCQYANEVWQGIKPEHEIHLRRNSFISPRTWVLEFVERSSDVQITTAAVAVWHIWDARNKAREGEGILHPTALAAKINAYIDMILNNLYTPSANHRRELSQSAKWVPPPEGMVLLNVDAAMFAASKQMGTGIVARNHVGSFVAACSTVTDDVILPELAEAMSIRQALSFAREEGFPKIILASDCLSVIQRIKSSMTDRSPFGSVIEDIKTSSKYFISCYFRHVVRVLNVPAHQLARGCSSLANSVWRGVPPDCIREALCNDLMIMDQ
jgi:hypothetical protein